MRSEVWIHWWVRFATWHRSWTRSVANFDPDLRHVFTLLTLCWCALCTVWLPMVLQWRKYGFMLLCWAVLALPSSMRLRFWWERHEVSRRNVRLMYRMARHALKRSTQNGYMFHEPPSTQLHRLQYALVRPIVPWYQGQYIDRDGVVRCPVPKEVTVCILYWLIKRNRAPWTARSIFKYHLAATGRGRWDKEGELVQAYKEMIKDTNPT